MSRLSLTEYAGRLYARPGVEPLLLELQDEAGQDVLLLLMACWLGTRGVRAEAPLWQSLRDRQAPWRERVIEPLRQVRRALTGDADAAALRAQVKDCELAAEWHQLEQLEAMCLALTPAADAALSGVRAHLALSGEGANDARLEQLAVAATVMEQDKAAPR